jgi:TonB family protein
MEAFALYVFRASVYLLVFALGYHLLFRRDDRHGFGRFFILGSFALSLLLAGLPWLPFVRSLSQAAATQAITLPEFVIQASEETNSLSHDLAERLAGMSQLTFLLSLTSLLFLMGTFAGLARIGWLIHRHPAMPRDGMRVVLFNDPASTFSFFRYVFVPRQILHHDHFPRILAHEKAHWELRHSYDILFLEALRMVFWFHPAYYYLKRELKARHEYQADRIACQSIPAADYQQALLEYSLGGMLVPLTNPFNVSPIKKRIMMMNQKTHLRSSRILLKTLLFLPFLLAAVAFQSCQEQPSAESVLPEAAPEAEAAPVKVSGDVFMVVETPPAFPGGEEARIRYLQETLRYPKEARDAGEQGTVFVTFVITNDGRIADARVLRGVSPALDEEALRVVRMMPAWEPGQQRGEKVNVQFNMPIRFVLRDDPKQTVIVVE